METQGQDDAVEAYLAACRQRVDAFAQRTFSLAGTLGIMRRTFAKDLVKYPINFFLAVPSLVVKTVADWLNALGWDQLARLVAKLPVPLETAFERAIERAVVHDLLQAPDDLQESLREPLAKYRAARSTILDGSNSGLTLLAAYLLFGDSSLSPYAMGDKIARDQARREGVSGFVLGRRAGSVFYDLFPAHPTAAQVWLAMTWVLLGLALLSIVTSLLTNPLQQTVAVHRRQLLRLIDSFEERLYLRGRRGPVVVPAAKVEPVVTGPGVRERLLRSYRDAVTTYGRRRLHLAFGAAFVLFAITVYAIVDRSREDPLREARALISDGAYTTALARLDAVSRQQKLAEYWYLRGRAHFGAHAYDSGVEAYRSAIQRDVTYRENDTLIADLVSAVAQNGNAKAKSLLLTEVGPSALSAVTDLVESEEKIDRWSLVEIAEKLGGADELDYRDIAIEDLKHTTTCAEHKRALQKSNEHHVKLPRSTLEKLDAQPDLKCLQPTLKPMLAE